MGLVTCVTPAVQGRTDLPSPKCNAGSLSVALDMLPSQGIACKIAVIQISNDYY